MLTTKRHTGFLGWNWSSYKTLYSSPLEVSCSRPVGGVHITSIIVGWVGIGFFFAWGGVGKSVMEIMQALIVMKQCLSPS